MNNINKVLKEFDETFPCNVKKWENNEWKEHYVFLDPIEIKQFITKALQDRDKEVIEMVDKEIESMSDIYGYDDNNPDVGEVLWELRKKLKQLKERNV